MNDVIVRLSFRKVMNRKVSREVAPLLICRRTSFYFRCLLEGHQLAILAWAP